MKFAYSQKTLPLWIVPDARALRAVDQFAHRVFRKNPHCHIFFFRKQAKELRRFRQFLLRVFDHGGAAPRLTYRGSE
jgi:hypothetical protein